MRFFYISTFKHNILITDNARFIGSHIVHPYVNKYQKYHIISLNKLTYVSHQQHPCYRKPLPVYGKGENACDWLYMVNNAWGTDSTRLQKELS